MQSQHTELPSLSTSLLHRVQQMQPEAWANMVKVFSPIVYHWARKSGLSKADAADVVQDVFAAIVKSIGTFERRKQTASFRSWLATITRNRVRDHFRRIKRNAIGVGGTDALKTFQNLADGRYDAAEFGSTVVTRDVGPSDDFLNRTIDANDLEAQLPGRVVDTLRESCDPHTWQAFWLVTVEGVGAADVARRLDMSMASVYQAKSRMLNRLRKRLLELP